MIRLAFVLMLIAVALWRAGLDWQATIGHGYAYRLTSIEAALAAAWPERWAAFVTWAEARGIWDPVGATLAALPLALVLLALAAILWLTRRRQRGR